MPVRLPKTPAQMRRQPERSRAAILQAAMREFAQEGVAGARTDAIAKAAGVNKALLYYYFKDKAALYGAVLDEVFGGLTRKVLPVLDGEARPQQKILFYVQAHFDYIAQSPTLPKLVLGEMMRAGRTPSPQMNRLVERYHRPLFAKLARVIADGIATGDFRPVDPVQFVPSMIALVVFYFAVAPVIARVIESDPLSADFIRARRSAVLDTISAALFVRPDAYSFTAGERLKLSGQNPGGQA